MNKLLSFKRLLPLQFAVSRVPRLLDQCIAVTITVLHRVINKVLRSCSSIYAIIISFLLNTFDESAENILFFIIKPTRCTNFPNLLRHETLHVSGSFSVRHQEFIHCTLGTGICNTDLKTAFEQDQDGPARKLSSNLYDIYQRRVYSE